MYTYQRRREYREIRLKLHAHPRYNSLMSRLRKLRSLAASLLLIYAAATFFLWFRQEALLFFPRPESVALAGQMGRFETAFDIGGETLDGWYIPGSRAETIVYYGGNAEELSGRIDDITRLGDFNYLLINYRGYGDSSGLPGEEALKADAIALLEAAAGRYGFAIEEVILIGRSLGSGVAVAVAATYPVKGLVLVTPYDSVLEVARARYPVFPVALLLRHPFDSLAYVAEVSAPTLVIKAATDRIVPHRHTDNLIANWQSPLTVVTLPGNHGGVTDSAEYLAELVRFTAGLVN